jgi:hypothetical protein
MAPTALRRVPDFQKSRRTRTTSMAAKMMINSATNCAHFVNLGKTRNRNVMATSAAFTADTSSEFVILPKFTVDLPGV